MWPGCPPSEQVGDDDDDDYDDNYDDNVDDSDNNVARMSSI